MAQIKIINFELEQERAPVHSDLYQLHIDFEFIVTKVELMEARKYAVQFSIGGTDSDKQQFKLAGCEKTLTVSMADYYNDLSRGHVIDEYGKLHYVLNHVCKNIELKDIDQNRKVRAIESVFVMADLYAAENRLLLGFTGSASRNENRLKSLAG